MGIACWWSEEQEGLTKQNMTNTLQPDSPLALPVETYLNITVLLFWLRELWLRYRTKQGVPVDARVESICRTQSGYKSAARVELHFSYEFQGHRYSGRVVRDFVFGDEAADSLVSDHEHGQTIDVLVDPRHPESSYYPSGFGWAEPLFVGMLSLGMWAFLLIVVVVLAVKL